ncbi:MAG: ABC transporter permease subunit [Candidatus Tectomicrobia bacterium]|nr:ABC transporter permease subunit [Candidatus Tectomicrobia bacterium]
MGRLVPAVLLALFVSLSWPGWAADRPVVVGSKNFEESRLLAEMFAQVIEEHAGLHVTRRFNLAGTQVLFEGLKTGAIDVYPEYTGTGLVSILKAPARGDPAAVLAEVRREFLRRWDLLWLAPLGFENAYELAVRKSLAKERKLRTLSDLAAVSGTLRGGFGYEFVARPDGLPGLERAYGLRFAEVRRLQQALKYRAAAAGEVDVIDVYTTDGRLALHGLQILEDDRRFFPPYQAAPLARGELLRRRPEAGRALALLSGLLDEERMRRLNRRLQEEREPVSRVARNALEEIGLAAGSKAREAESLGTPGLPAYLWAERRTLGARTLEHLGMVSASLLLAALVAVPLGLALERRRGAAEAVIRGIGVTQTIPSIALLAFMIPLLGVGVRPAVAALWVYALFPIVRNTYTGVRGADPAAVESALALGMTPAQVLGRVRLPLAAPVILAGVRTSAVINVGTATLAAFIGAGGLGEPIVTGLQLTDTTLILSGALPAAVLALLVDGALGLLERALRPRGLEGRS